MDTSETYIKMRLAAIPDLGMGTPPDFSAGMEWVTDEVVIDCKGDWYCFTVQEWCQLERQDQLQEMVNWEINDMTYKLETFTEGFAIGWSFIKGNGEASWEQLWMAFVMKEKHGKQWSGTEWVKG